MENKDIMNYEKSVIEELKINDELLDNYINNSIKNFNKTKDIKMFLFNLRCIVAAKSGMSRIAKKTNLTQQGLYQMFHNEKFKLNNFISVLNSVGLSLNIKSAK